MADSFVDQVYIEIEGVEMKTIKSFSPTPANPKAPVKTMNRERVARGVTQGTQDFPFKMTVARQVANPEQDWHAWAATKQAKEITYELGDGGLRVTLIDCYLNSVDEKYDEAGEAVWDIDGFALKRRED